MAKLKMNEERTNEAIFQYYLQYGIIPTKDQLNTYSKIETEGLFNIPEASYQKALQNLYNSIENGEVPSLNSYNVPNRRNQSSIFDAQGAAFDSYYNDLYSLQDGTLGAHMLDQFTKAEQNAAISNMQLAEAQYQQAAMQQAELVKSITDSVKAERMARLRAGMSESQIANQDMQIMLNNMNTLNQQVDLLNQNRLAVQQQYQLAQDTAYQQYINSAMNMATNGAAFSAAGAGSLDYVARQIQAKTGWNYDDALKAAKTPTT